MSHVQSHHLTRLGRRLPLKRKISTHWQAGWLFFFCMTSPSFLIGGGLLPSMGGVVKCYEYELGINNIDLYSHVFWPCFQSDQNHRRSGGAGHDFPGCAANFSGLFMWDMWASAMNNKWSLSRTIMKLRGIEMRYCLFSDFIWEILILINMQQLINNCIKLHHIASWR